MRRSLPTNASRDSAEVLIVELDAITTSASPTAKHGDAAGAVKRRELRTVGAIEHAQHRRFGGPQSPRTLAKADSALTGSPLHAPPGPLEPAGHERRTRKELAPSAGSRRDR